jgi:hypothetical protein
VGRTFGLFMGKFFGIMGNLFLFLGTQDIKNNKSVMITGHYNPITIWY